MMWVLLRIPSGHVAAQALGIEVPRNVAPLAGLNQRVGRMGVLRLLPHGHRFRVAFAAGGRAHELALRMLLRLEALGAGLDVQGAASSAVALGATRKAFSS